jgi:hypothetical protein
LRRTLDAKRAGVEAAPGTVISGSFEESGHEPFADEPVKFNASMVELVLSVALSTTAAWGDQVQSRALAASGGRSSAARFPKDDLR